MFEFYADDMNYSTRMDKLIACFDPIDLYGDMLIIKKVIFNPPATIAFWNDGTKTVVKCMAGDIYDPYAGLALCYSKKLLGRKFHKTFKKYCESYEEEGKEND